MSTFLKSTIAVAAVVIGTAAFAETTTTDGTVLRFDLKEHVLILDSGVAYTLPEAFVDPGLKMGEKVQVTWEPSGFEKRVDAIKITG